MKRYIVSSATPSTSYVVFAEGTWSNGRALFRKRQGPAEFTTEANAEKFDRQAAEALCRSRGKYKWVMKEVRTSR